MTRQVESEFDDATRELMLGLAQYEAETCPGCNLHKSILDRPDAHRFTFEERVCNVCKAQDTYGRLVADRDEKARKRIENAPPSVPRPGDGRHIYLRPLTPEEIERVTKRQKGGA